MYCKHCGNIINDETKFCPNCGGKQMEKNSTVEPPMPVENKPSSNAFAIVGFVISLISLLLNFLGLVGIAAVIVSVLGLIKVDAYNGHGKSMSIVGIVIGGISILYGFLTIF